MNVVDYIRTSMSDKQESYRVWGVIAKLSVVIEEYTKLPTFTAEALAYVIVKWLMQDFDEGEE